MVAGDQLGFGFGHIEGGAVEFGGGAGNEYEEGHGLDD